MSFSQQVKTEIAGRKFARHCCARAACYGAACFARSLGPQGISLVSELEPVSRYIRKAFAACEIAGETVPRQYADGPVYEFTVSQPEEIARAMDTFHMKKDDPNLRIDPSLFVCRDCFRHFLGMAFVCSGTMPDPEKDYGIEFLTPRHNLARDLEAMLAEYEFNPHRTTRGGVNVVYVKSSERLIDMLAFMGAGDSSMQLMEIKTERDVNNHTNRLKNCDMANIGKMVKANGRTAQAIEYIELAGALDDLPETLRQTAILCKNHPQTSLAELARLASPPVSKSGLSHRVQKLQQLAEQLRQRRGDE